MSFELPLYKQEKDNTCALACLRMVLAAFGTEVSEAAIEAQAAMAEKGTSIIELERLARWFGLVANIQEATIEDLQRILEGDSFPIAYIDRAVFDLSPQQRKTHRLGDARIHTVIPVAVNRSSITYHDPLYPSVTRRTVRLYLQAYSRLGGLCVVCSRPSTPM
jgi:hypothetical protein